MKILTDYKELEGKTIAFSHMAQFAKQITLATTDGEVLMATFELDEYGEESQIRVFLEHHVIKTIQESEYLRNELGRLGAFDLEAYKKRQEELQVIRRQKAKKLQEKREREQYEKLKAKFENQ